MFACALIVGGLFGCERTPSASDAGSLAALLNDDRAPAPEHFVSRRCAECHGRQQQEWRGSAHARAASGAYVRAVESLSAAEAAECAACHVPLSSARRRIAAEGVTCDACHTAVGPSDGKIAVTLAPELSTRFGPYRDSKDHHFHKVAFSEFVVGPGLCVSCHQDRKPGPLPIFTSVAEWRAGAHAAVECQTCHMPNLRAAAAKGEATRSVSRHDFGADKSKVLSAAIDLSLDSSKANGGSQAVIRIENTGAGHALPTDLPERRLRLVITASDGQAEEVHRTERAFGRLLLDAKGTIAPFFRAVREGADTRLQPGVAQTVTVPLPPRAAQVTAQLFYERFDPRLQDVYGQMTPELVMERSIRLR